jgi:hypothetical protein
MKMRYQFLMFAAAGLFVSVVHAQEKGFPMYSQEKRDVALVMSDRISRTIDMPVEFKRVSMREVPVEIKTRVDEIMESTSSDQTATRTVFEVKRESALANKERTKTHALAKIDSDSAVALSDE